MRKRAACDSPCRRRFVYLVSRALFGVATCELRVAPLGFRRASAMLEPIEFRLNLSGLRLGLANEREVPHRLFGEDV